MVDRRLAVLRLADLDWDDLRYEIRSFAPLDLLEASFERVGVLAPPCVACKEGGRYAIVDGFKRLRWMWSKGREEVACLALSAELDSARLMRWRIEGKLFGPQFNPSEKAQLIARIAGAVLEKQAALEYFRILGVPPRPEVIERWVRLAGESNALLEALASDVVSERAALQLMDWDSSARMEGLRTLTGLRCSASIQVEILQLAAEVAAVRDVPKLEILQASAVSGILEHPQWDRRTKTQSLRELLYRWRYPRLQARQESFKQAVSAARLPAAVRFVPPAAFEGDRWQVQISFASPDDLLSLLNELHNYAASTGLESLMHPPR